MDLEKEEQKEPQKQQQVLESAQTLVERAAEATKTQATEAAEAWRRGEFMQEATKDSGANDDDRLISLLCYVFQIPAPMIMPAIVLISKSSQRRPFQRYHAIQSLALTLVFFGVGLFTLITSSIVSLFLGPLSILVWIAFACTVPIASLMYIIAHLYYGYQAYQGKRFAIPGITSFVRDQGWLE